MPNAIDKTMVFNYWTKMLRKFNAKTYPKSKSWQMTVAGRILERRGVMSRAKFADMVTTIGRTIYTPFKLGTPSDGWDLEQQLATCAHEMVHVVQAGKGSYRFYYRYLTSDSSRVQYEMEGYGANLMAHHLITGKYLMPGDVAGLLRNYGASNRDILRAARYYTSINFALKCGDQCGHPAARLAVKELRGLLG